MTGPSSFHSAPSTLLCWSSGLYSISCLLRWCYLSGMPRWGESARLLFTWCSGSSMLLLCALFSGWLGVRSHTRPVRVRMGKRKSLGGKSGWRTSTRGLAHTVPRWINPKAAFQTVEERSFEENVDKSTRVLFTPFFFPITQRSKSSIAAPQGKLLVEVPRPDLSWSLPLEGVSKLLGLAGTTLLFGLLSWIPRA